VVIAKEANYNDKERVYVLKGISDDYPSDIKNIHAVIDYKNAKAGEKIQFVWIAVDSISIPNYKIVDVNVTLSFKNGTARSIFTRGPSPLPKGNYRVDIYSNGQKLASRGFKIYQNVGIAANKDSAKEYNSRLGRILFAADVGVDNKGMMSPKGVSDTFSPKRHVIVGVAEYFNVKPNSTFNIEWIAVNAGNMHGYTILNDKVTVKLKNGAIKDKITVQMNWPVGEYKMSIYLGKKFMGSKNFWIKKP